MTMTNYTRTKTCSYCKKEKPTDQFFKCKACKDGLRGECKQCVASKQKVYNRKNAKQISEQKKRYRQENIEADRQSNARYYRENAERIKRRAREYHHANKEQVSIRAKEYREKNRAQILEQRACFRRENRESLREQYRRFYEKHKDRLRPKAKAAKAMRRAAGGTITKRDVERKLKYQCWRCAICKVSIRDGRYHLDHVYPLSRGGANVPCNMQMLCPTCNLSKSAKDPIDFMQERGFLL